MANYNLFDAASLAMVPTGIKDGKLYSVKPNDGAGDFTFSRGSNLTATRVNADGLIEKGRENLLVQSNQFNTTWSTSNASLTSGQSGYDGSTDAWLLSKSAANGFLYQTHTFVGVQTISIYAKAGTSNWLNINVGGATYGGYFDLSNGVTGNNIGSPIATKITDVGGGWYRCEASGTYSGTTSFRIYVADSNGSTSGTSGSIYIQDAQLEQGLVATDYIETTTAPVSAGITENLPRIDYSGGCGSLLLEPQRVNLIPHSEYFGTDWSLSNATITSNAATSPEGVNNASLYTATNVANSMTDAITAANGTYTLSVFVKRVATDEFRMNFSDGVTGEIRYVFNLLDETSTITKSGGTISNFSADFENYGNGWYRLHITATTNSGTAITSYFEADNQTGSYYVYGAQLEAGSYPTSYIPTYGSAATREKDFATADVTSALSSNKGTLFVHLDNDANSGGYGSGALSIGLQDSSGQNFVGWASNSPAATELRGIYKGNNVTDYLGASTPINTECKLLIKWDSGNATFFKDGYHYNTQSITTFNGQPLRDFLLPNQFRVGKFPIKQTLVFPTALTDNECKALTRPYDTYQEWVDGEGLTWESKSCTVQNIVELQNL